MKRGCLWTLIALTVAALLAAGPLLASAADTSKVDQATEQVETGAKKIGEGKIGEGVEETARGIGKTVVEGAKLTGETLKDAGHAAEPKTKSAWEKVRDGATDFGQGVKNFFSRLFGS